jgi:hypothetical protein
MALEFQAAVNSWDVSRSIARSGDMQRDNYRGMIDFILDIDEHVCDLQFTKALYAKLGTVIEECES